MHVGFNKSCYELGLLIWKQDQEDPWRDEPIRGLGQVQPNRVTIVERTDQVSDSHCQWQKKA